MSVNGRSMELTQRQREVLGLVRKGRTNREIAQELGISEDGVKAHLSRLFLRFGVTNRVELLGAANEDPRLDRTHTSTVPLGTLRAIAGRANASIGEIETAPSAPQLMRQLTAVRDALAAVDLALDLVSELPPETTGPVIGAVRKRIGTALDALDAAAQAIPTALPA